MLKFSARGKFLWEDRIVAQNDFNTILSLDLALDRRDNVYVGGTFSDACDFDPGPDQYVLRAARPGHWDSAAFLAKYDRDGKFVFANKWGGRGGEVVVHRIVVGPDDDVYVAGHFTGRADLDTGKGELFLDTGHTSFPSATDVKDVFVARFDHNGRFRSARQLDVRSNATRYWDLPLFLARSGQALVVTDSVEFLQAAGHADDERVLVHRLAGL
jgi:hypothetical protein